MQAITRCAAKGIVNVASHDGLLRYTVGWEGGDVVATQGNALIRVDGRGAVGVPGDPAVARYDDV